MLLLKHFDTFTHLMGHSAIQVMLLKDGSAAFNFYGRHIPSETKKKLPMYRYIIKLKKRTCKKNKEFSQ